MPDCLFCHATQAHYVEGSVNHYTQPVFHGDAIGCQRCHGPGEIHVAQRTKDQAGSAAVDYSIVNPRHLERSLRDAVCEQCHLVGHMRILRNHRGWYDYRPGLPLEQFFSAFMQPENTDDEDKAVGQVEQMYESRCFQRSKG